MHWAKPLPDLPPFPMTRFPSRPALLAALTLILPCVAGLDDASARVLSVETSGSDTASGTAADPLRTISKAALMARQGDSVVVGEGRYPEMVTIGSLAAGTTFQAKPGTRPVIDGEQREQYGLRITGARVNVTGFEVRGQRGAGIYAGSVGGQVADNLVHHVGVAEETYATGIRVVRANGSRIADNEVHHIGPGGESMGVWLMESRDVTVQGNAVYMARKNGVRDWKGLDNTITGNRIFLNQAGISLNTSTGSQATDNYVYDNVEGIAVKHASYQQVLDYWNLSAGRMTNVTRNTVYRSSEASLWVAQSDEPLDHLAVTDNILSGAGTAFLRDRPDLRGPDVRVDGNAYSNQGGQPSWIYKSGWNSDPGLNDWDEIRRATGWEARGEMSSMRLAEPEDGDFSVAVADARRPGVGAATLPPARLGWRPYQMTPVDSSSPGTWSTRQHLNKTADGRQHTYWMPNTNSREYVTFDFGARRTFNHILATPFSHFDKRNPRGYRFEVSDDGQTWRTIRSGENPDSAGSVNIYEFDEPITARYLRYTMVSVFCSDENVPSTCGAQFVLSEVQAGLLAERSSLPAISDLVQPTAPSTPVSAGPTGAAKAPAAPRPTRSRPRPAPAPKQPPAAAKAVRTSLLASGALPSRGRNLLLRLECRKACGRAAITLSESGRRSRSSRSPLRRRFFLTLASPGRRSIRVRVTKAQSKRLRRARVVLVTVSIPGQAKINLAVRLRAG